MRTCSHKPFFDLVFDDEDQPGPLLLIQLVEFSFNIIGRLVQHVQPLFQLCVLFVQFINMVDVGGNQHGLRLKFTSERQILLFQLRQLWYITLLSCHNVWLRLGRFRVWQYSFFRIFLKFLCNTKIKISIDVWFDL